MDKYEQNRDKVLKRVGMYAPSELRYFSKLNRLRLKGHIEVFTTEVGLMFALVSIATLDYAGLKMIKTLAPCEVAPSYKEGYKSFIVVNA